MARQQSDDLPVTGDTPPLADSPPPRALAWRSRAEFRAADGVLLVLRNPPAASPPAAGQPPTVGANPAEGAEILLALADDGQVVALAGHVDLGTGLRTALGQIVAEELDLALERVHVVLGDTAVAPNQGATIASSSVQIHAEPLRRAAAQARAWLIAAAATRWGLPSVAVRTAGGEVVAPDARALPYAGLVAGRRTELWLDPHAPVKSPDEYTLVGSNAPRVDLPDKLTGADVYVHDVRRPGMLHGRVVRPPYAGLDAGEFVGRSLLGVDESSIAHVPGIVRLVVLGDFIGIVAQREEQAEAAMHALRCDWAPFTPIASLDDLAQALSAHPSSPRVVHEQGQVDAMLASDALAQRLDRRYVWPYQLHASIGPSCAVAEWNPDPAGDRATVWAGTQNPHALRADLARLVGLADTAVDVIRLEASGCYGRNCADDVAADALLLARAVGVPVRVQLTREQEHAWEPKGSAQLMEVRGGLDVDGAPAAYDFSTSYPSNGAPTLALLLTGTVPATAQAFEMGDRTSVPPYAYAHQRITVNDMAPILRASWLRGVSALPNSFAHECYIDELADAAGVDPVAYRLQHLPDARAAELLQATAAKAGWIAHTAPRRQAPNGPWLQGQGVAYARYIHSRFPGYGAAWAAWVADVEVHATTGEVHVKRVVVGHDAGLMINPKGVEQQVHGNVLQTASRALKERVAVTPDKHTVQNAEWGSYPILTFREVPVVEVLLMPRPGEPPLGVGESSSVPGTAAIANAIFDATGVRLRQPPFTPEVVRAALLAGGEASPAAAAAPPAAGAADAAAPMHADAARGLARDPQRRHRRWWSVAGALTTATLGLAAAGLGWRPAVAPVEIAAAGVYTPELLARGERLAALGNCEACHTAEDGEPNAGGRPVHTPFGTVYSTNLTPDADTGIGRWSFTAFQRAMREGVSRDGHHLYPAFPYASYRQASDADLQAIYAYLITRPAVRHTPPATRLAFPFNLRPLLGPWKALYLSDPSVSAATPAPARNAQWYRGAELVNGLGHCGACHSPRDALGAEQARHYLAGALSADGWEAPPLGALARGPVPWTEAAMRQYLTQGHHPRHGVAAGPMAAVVRGLAHADAADVAAIAHYLVSLQSGDPTSQAASESAAEAAADALAAARVADAAARGATLPSATQRLFETACGACHHDGDGPQTLGPNQPLALNVNLHSPRADNLLRTILDGLWDPPFAHVGHMPAFRHALDDAQIAQLAAYMRRRFAPGQPPWTDLQATAARLRAAMP